MAPRDFLRNTLLIYAPPLLWMGVIWHTSSIHGSGDNFEQVIGFDKLLHVVAYFTLCGLITRLAFFQSVLQSWSRMPLVPGAAIALLFGIADEIHQAYVIGRSASPLDLMADVAGIALYVGMHSILLRRERSPVRGETARRNRGRDTTIRR